MKRVKEVKSAGLLGSLLASATLLFANPQLEPTATSDVAVFKAVIDGRIRPEAERLFPQDRSLGTQPLIAYDRTLAMCGSDNRPVANRSMGCLAVEDVQRLDFKGAVAQAVREELVRGLVVRNRVSVPFPSAKLESIISAAPEQLEQVETREARRTHGHLTFSMPAYASNRQAAVYARYICGNACGYYWLFLVEREPERSTWRVVAAQLLAIS